MSALILIAVVVLVVVGIVVMSQQRSGGNAARQLDDAKADARQSIERLGGQVFMLVGDGPASKQALADAGVCSEAIIDAAEAGVPASLRPAIDSIDDGLSDRLDDGAEEVNLCFARLTEDSESALLAALPHTRRRPASSARTCCP